MISFRLECLKDHYINTSNTNFKTGTAVIKYAMIISLHSRRHNNKGKPHGCWIFPIILHEAPSMETTTLKQEWFPCWVAEWSILENMQLQMWFCFDTTLEFNTKKNISEKKHWFYFTSDSKSRSFIEHSSPLQILDSVLYPHSNLKDIYLICTVCPYSCYMNCW